MAWRFIAAVLLLTSCAAAGPHQISPFIVRGFAVGDSGVYWVDDGRLVRISKDRGERVPLAVTFADGGALALDATSIYWRDSCVGALFRLDKVGGVPSVLARIERDPSGCPGRRSESTPEQCQYVCSILALDDQ